MKFRNYQMEPNALIVWSRAGLSNRLHALVNALYLKKVTGRPTYSCWPLNEALNVPPTDLFTYPLPLLNESVGRSVLQAPLVGTSLFLRTNPHKIISVRSPLVLDEIPSTFIREVLRQLDWHPSIKIRVNEIQKQYGIDRSVCGIHARGTDITQSTKLLAATQVALNRVPGRIFLCTDDPLLQERIRDPRITLLPHQSRYTKEGMRQAVIDLLLLASTTICFYSPLSTYSWIAIALSEAPVHSIPRRQVHQILAAL